jgi:hypothetical protein
MAASSNHAVSGFTRPNVALNRSGLLNHPVTVADRPSLRSLSGHRPRISYPASPLAIRFYLTSCFEQRAITQHGVHDDSKTLGKRHAGFS